MNSTAEGFYYASSLVAFLVQSRRPENFSSQPCITEAGYRRRDLVSPAANFVETRLGCMAVAVGAVGAVGLAAPIPGREQRRNPLHDHTGLM